MRYHTFRGRKYKIKKIRKGKDYLGICDPPDEIGKVIEIPVEGKNKTDLSTIIHEALHASFWDLDDQPVDEGADSIANFLWRLGWRKIK